MTKEVVARQEGALIHPMWNDEEKALIRETVAPGLNDMEFKFFLYYAASLGLNPIAKEIYAIKYGNKLVPQVAIDGFLKHAQNTGKFRGFTEPEITVRAKDGEVKCVAQKLYDPDNHKIVAATIGVKHADDQEPTFVTATAKEYAVYFGDKLGDRWAKAPTSQLVKCAKALAIRTRFPGMGGAYLAEEMRAEAVDVEFRKVPETGSLSLGDFREKPAEPTEPPPPEDTPPGIGPDMAKQLEQGFHARCNALKLKENSRKVMEEKLFKKAEVVTWDQTSGICVETHDQIMVWMDENLPLPEKK
jgi:phage recombination protein Bet